MYTCEFTKHWDSMKGFTEREAIEKKCKVDEAHGVNSRYSKWEPAVIVPDTSKQEGFKVVIKTKV